MSKNDMSVSSPSFWPIILALGIMLILGGLAVSIGFTIAGAIVIVTAVIGWVIEPTES